MGRDPGLTRRVDRCVRLVLEMLDESRLQEAVLLLFSLHRSAPSEWVLVHDRLLSACLPAQQRDDLSKVLYCSALPDLADGDHLVPGIGRFSTRDEYAELFD